MKKRFLSAIVFSIISLMVLFLVPSGKAQDANDILSGANTKNSYAYIQTVADTLIKTNSGVLRRINVTGGTAGQFVVYDSAAGPGVDGNSPNTKVVANYDSTNAIASYAFDTPFVNGLEIHTSSATKITAIYN